MKFSSLVPLLFGVCVGSAFAQEATVSEVCLVDRYQYVKTLPSSEGQGPDSRAVMRAAIRRYTAEGEIPRTFSGRTVLIESEVAGYQARICSSGDSNGEANRASCRTYWYDLDTRGRPRLIAIDRAPRGGPNTVTFVCD